MKSKASGAWVVIWMVIWALSVSATLLMMVGCGADAASVLAPTVSGGIERIETQPAADSPVGPVPAPVSSAMTVTGPAGCVTKPSGDQVWKLTGARAADLILMVHHSGTPGCEATTENPRRPGLLTVAATSDGVLVTYPLNGWASWVAVPCGRVQVDVADRASGRLYVGMDVNYGTVCPLVVPPVVPPVPPVVVPPVVVPPVVPPPVCDPGMPAWTLPTPGDVGGTIVGTAVVRNPGKFTLKLLAGSKPGTADFVKDLDDVTLKCGEQSALRVSYPGWLTHPSRYWWTEMAINGQVVGASGIVTRP